MIVQPYQSIVRNELSHAADLFLTLLVANLPVLKQVKLERLAEALPLPILFESRRKKLQRFLKLEGLSLETLWFPCVSYLHGTNLGRLTIVGLTMTSGGSEL